MVMTISVAGLSKAGLGTYKPRGQGQRPRLRLDFGESYWDQSEQPTLLLHPS